MIYWVDLMGTFVFAISGVLAAMEKRFDLFGVTILALVTALGGGTLRDVLIGSTPVGWMLDVNYFVVVVIAVPVAIILRNRIQRLRKTMFLFDTLGIGLFTVLGVNKTLALGLSPVIAIIMGAVSAVFGGVLRDLLSGEIPLIFRKEIYATACLLGGAMYVLISSADPSVSVLVSMVTVVVIRLLAVKYHWSLPIISRN